MGAGRGVLGACFDRTAAVCLPGCLSATQSSCLGGKGQDEGGGKRRLLTGLSRQTHPGGGRGQADWEILLRPCLGAHSDSFCYYFLNSELSRLEPGC